MSDSIEEIEKLTGVQLPADLASFYSGGFGQITLPAEIDVPDSSPWIEVVEDLYDADEALSLLQEDVRSMEYGCRQFPPRTIPIGGDGNGDYFVVSLRDTDFGAILFPFHETCDRMDESLEGAYFLAPNLRKWVESFRPKTQRIAIPDWEAIRVARLQEILHPKAPWWKFWAKARPRPNSIGGDKSKD
jgi:hypothetical protein